VIIAMAADYVTNVNFVSSNSQQQRAFMQQQILYGHG